MKGCQSLGLVLWDELNHSAKNARCRDASRLLDNTPRDGYIRAYRPIRRRSGKRVHPGGVCLLWGWSFLFLCAYFIEFFFVYIHEC